jgi:hypothetical protein
LERRPTTLLIYYQFIQGDLIMALSESVEQSLDEASSALKNALAYSARQEAPFVSVGIANMIQTIESIKQADKFQDKVQDFINKNNNIDGFFN